MQTESIFSKFDVRSMSQRMMLALFTFGVFVLALVGWVTWNDITFWNKDIGTIFFGSRTGEAIGLGIGMAVIHYFLIGVSLLAAGLVLFLRNRIMPTEPQQTMIMKTQKMNTENPSDNAKSVVIKRPKQQDIIEHIMDIVDSKQPESVEQLLRLLSQEYAIDKKEIMECIMLLQNQGKLRFVSGSPLPLSSKKWFFSTETVWFWVITILAVVTAAVLLDVTEQSSSIYYVRPLLASAFVLYVPGYSMTKALFTKKELDSIEKTALSIVMSVSLVLAIAFIFNYTPWGIRLVPVTLSLLVVTLISSIVALVRGYRSRFRKKA